MLRRPHVLVPKFSLGMETAWRPRHNPRQSPSAAYGLVRFWCVLLAFSGCQTLPPLDSETALVPAASSTVDLGIECELDPDMVEQLQDLLSQPAWQVDVRWSVLSLEAREPSQPWRYVFLPATDEMTQRASLVDDSRWRPLFTGTLETFDDRERQAVLNALEQWRTGSDLRSANAAILQARWNVACGAAPSAAVLSDLESMTLGTTSTPLTMRCAAAEAWCRGLLQHGESCGSSTDCEASLMTAGRLLERVGIPDELRATVWRTLALRMAPNRLPGLSRTLDEARHQALRRAAMEACVLHASWNALNPIESPWPAAVDAVRLDSDPVLRQLFARWLALSQPAQATAQLVEMTRDADLAVQEQAVYCLGRIATDESRDALRHLARKSHDRLRAVAVSGLSAWDVSEIRPFVDDDALPVRLAAAKALGSRPGPDAARLLSGLLTDVSLEVQSAAVAAVADWPADQAVPVLLDAICSSALRTRQQAQRMLQHAARANVNFPLEAVPAERELAVRTWATQYGWTWPWRAQERPAVVATARDSQDRLGELVDACLASAAAPIAAELWSELRSSAVPLHLQTIERRVHGRTDPAAEQICRELLPELSPLYAAVEGLNDREVLRRREAARKLASLSADNPLSPALLCRLKLRLEHEQDQIVWQSCMAAVQREGHAEAAQIALLAMHNPWPDVRRLGVDYVAQHPGIEAARWLAPLFQDSHRTVRLAAIEAAAHCGNPVVLDGWPAAADGVAVPGLRSLLLDADVDLRWSVLVTMARLGDQSACQELVRLTFDPQPKTRERAVRAMAQSRQPRFVEPLLKLLWSEPQEHLRMTALAGLEALVPAENQPVLPTGLAGPASIDDKIQAWTAWWTAARSRTNASLADRDDQAASQEPQ